MSDAKRHQFRPPLYHDDHRSRSSDAQGDSRAGNGTAPARGDENGWDAYRRWLSSVSGKPASQRAPLDRSIYSWKGYHNWADRIRQSWKNEES